MNVSLLGPKTTFLLCLTLLSQSASADVISETKPNAIDGDARLKCARLSDLNQRRGVRTLVIAFEGLASFSSSATRAAYDYHLLLSKGEKAEPSPVSAFGGFVARGLIMPTIKQAAPRFDFLIFPYTATNVANTCALEWVKVPGRQLILAGHSFGGMAAVRLAEELQQRNISILEVITIDPRTPFGTALNRTRNVLRWKNFYQRSIGLPGQSINEADVNQRLSGSHTGMPSQPAVIQALRSAILR